MSSITHKLFLAVLAASMPLAPALSQSANPIPGLESFTLPAIQPPADSSVAPDLVLAAKLTEESSEIPDGIIWRVFSPSPGPNGKLDLIATAEGGTQSFTLPPGSYLVHAAFGRAGATKRIKVGSTTSHEVLVLDAGGLKLDAVLPNGAHIPEEKLRFSIYESTADTITGERALITPDVKPNTIVRLNAGTYHIVSTYGPTAVIRSDIRVEAGELTEATVEHRAAEVALKLVREAGGEALADTAWSVVTEAGEVVLDTVGAFASAVLPEGNYTIIAKNRDRIYQRDVTVEAGIKQDVELLPENLAPTNGEITD